MSARSFLRRVFDSPLKWCTYSAVKWPSSLAPSPRHHCHPLSSIPHPSLAPCPRHHCHPLSNIPHPSLAPSPRHHCHPLSSIPHPSLAITVTHSRASLIHPSPSLSPTLEHSSSIPHPSLAPSPRHHCHPLSNIPLSVVQPDPPPQSSRAV